MNLIKIRIKNIKIVAVVTTLLTMLCFSGFIIGKEKKAPKNVFDVLEREGLFDAETIKELKDSHDPTTGLVGKQLSDVLDTVFQGIAGDPTSPPPRAKQKEEEEEELEEGEEAPTALNAIIISGKNKLAVMNGQVVKEGEIIGEKKLVEIHKNKVILEDITGSKEEFLLPRIRIIATEGEEKSEK